MMVMTVRTVMTVMTVMAVMAVRTVMTDRGAWGMAGAWREGTAGGHDRRHGGRAR